jgi:transposase InsO family protein
MAAADNLHNRVIRAYTTPGHAVAFSAPQRVSDYFGISEKKAKEILEHVEGYTLHREYKQPKHYNPYYVHNRRKQVQADLIDVSRLKRANDGICFLLVLIDIFTKRLWVYPTKNKSAETMKTAFTSWLRAIDRPPRRLVTDRGREFVNQEVQPLLRSYNVEWQASNGMLKACIAERVNKTLQILMYKYLSQKETHRYLDALPQLVTTYNNRGHRTLQGMTPAEADLPENEHQVQAIFHTRYTEAAKHRKTRLPYRIGDLVRIKTEPKKISSSARAYAEQFHGEYYRIVRINRTLPIALYYVQAVDDNEHVEGGFYANELQRQRGDVYKIEAILGRRTYRGRRQIRVKWRYFGEAWNEWIDEAAVVAAY